MAGSRAAARFRWLPVHPARRRTTAHGQVSWLPDRRRAPPSRLPSGVVGTRLPGHSCGGSAGLPPASLGGLAPAGPASRAIRDVGGDVTTRPRAVQLWHGARAADAVALHARYAQGAP